MKLLCSTFLILFAIFNVCISEIRVSPFEIFNTVLIKIIFQLRECPCGENEECDRLCRPVKNCKGDIIWAPEEDCGFARFVCFCTEGFSMPYLGRLCMPDKECLEILAWENNRKKM